MALGARADARDRLMVEVSRSAAPLIDPRATERLVELETADVDVPAPPAVSFRPPLYFRILSLSPGSLRVELWELGQPYGARSVSTVGSDNLKARRIALAAAELARRLRQRRLAEIAAASAPKGGDGDGAKGAGVPIYARFAPSVGVRAASLGVDSAWLVGPRLDATLRFSSGPRLSLGAAWLVGAAPVFGDSASARFFEVNLAFAEGFALAPRFDLATGLETGAGALRIGEPAGPSSGAIDSWSAHAAVFVRGEAHIARFLSVDLGPDVGALLRPVSVTGSDGETRRIAGLWLGGTLAVTLDPEAP